MAFLVGNAEKFEPLSHFVRAGDPIASLGSNANEESVLRFEVRRNGNPLNPMDFFPAN